MFIRDRDGGSSNNRVSVSVSDSFREGDKIEGNYRGRGRWYPGKISKDRGDKTYDIDYDDGEFEARVSESNIRLKDGGSSNNRASLSVSDSFREGDKVEGNYRGRGKWYPGKITRDRGDKTYDISYDDGESEIRVSEENIRKIGGSSFNDDRFDRISSSKLSEGDKVEGNYRGRGKCYPGKYSNKL